jgi:hypothetical protein
MPTQKSTLPAAPTPPMPAAPYTPAQSMPSSLDKPGMVTAITIMTLINGILNILWGLGVSLGALAGIVTICLIPFTILPTVLGIFEVIYAAKLLSDPPQPVQPSQTIAILEICCVLVGNVFSLVVGILALVFYNDYSVKNYFARINGSI